MLEKLRFIIKTNKLERLLDQYFEKERNVVDELICTLQEIQEKCGVYGLTFQCDLYKRYKVDDVIRIISKMGNTCTTRNETFKKQLKACKTF